ncbi:MAG: GNAT family N-acetyltransferase [Roseburia sp.]|nr:GNAT family N-acetyltransferase [Roseburia sp.]
MTNQEVYQIALQQSAYDCSCAPEDFLQERNVIVESKEDTRARRYLTLPFDCQLVSYGGNIVASVRGDRKEMVRAYIDRYPAERCFETPNLHILNDELQKRGSRVCFMAEYFLPDLDRLRALSCAYETRVLTQPDFADLYTDTWGNALCEKRRELDVLGVGAYDGDKLIGLAACSADCDTMWQIGIDVRTEYRRKGIASALTSRLAMEILARGKVPFYCAAWSNIKSVRNAIKSGFRPAWVELTAKSAAFVEDMNMGK